MISKLRMALLGVAVCALFCANANSLHASSIIKLNLGNVGADVSMDAAGYFGTVSDIFGGTTGNQNTDVEYTSFLNPIPDITTSIASFSMSNLLRTGPANVVAIPGPASLVIQSFLGGTFELYDPSNNLLLSGLLGTSSLQGTLGPPGTGALFTTSIATVTGGSLEDFIVDVSLGLSMNLTNVNGGAGFAVGGAGLVLYPFDADASVSILGDPTPLGGGLPEPGTLVLASMALVAAAGVRRR